MVTVTHAWFMELVFVMSGLRLNIQLMAANKVECLKKNMTITIESYIGKVGGKEGVKLEQQYLVGQNGLELMSHHPLEDI